MRNTREGKIFTIIICLALTAAVFISNNFIKEDGIKEDRNIFTVPSVTPEITPDSEQLLNEMSTANNSGTSNESANTYIEVKKPVTGTEGETSFDLLYTEALFALELKTDIYTNMVSEIKGYLSDRYGDKASDITKVAILEESIDFDKDNEMLSFGIRLDKGSTADYARITINLNTSVYSIKDEEI